MSFELKPQFTPEDYLTLERKAERKSEYFNGEIFAMAGASPQHVLIVTNVVAELRGQLKTCSCTVLFDRPALEGQCCRFVYLS